MLTNPYTLGLFEPGIEEIERIVHGVGATLYYDGANLNAIMGISRPGRHGLRHRALQPAQDVHPAPRRRRPGRRPDRRVRAVRALPAAAAGGACAAGGPTSGNGGSRSTTSTTTGPSRSAGCAASRATTASSSAPTPTSARSARTGLREMSEVAVLNANYLLARLRRRAWRSTCRSPTTACACTSSCSPAAPMKQRAEDPHARPRQAAARLRRAPADRLLPADRRRGAADRADRDRDARRRWTASPRCGEVLREAQRRSGGRAQRALHDPGPPPRRSRRRPAPGDPPAARRRMRFVVFGAGAIGGVVGARLHQAGTRVAVIARGAHYLSDPRPRPDAGRSPSASTALGSRPPTRRGACSGIRDEVVLLAIKSQDTAGALGALAGCAPAAHGRRVPAERGRQRAAALRLFRERLRRGGDAARRPHRAGRGAGPCHRLTGIVDLGRYPSGSDDARRGDRHGARGRALRSHVPDDVMRLKYAKLILNLANAVDAIVSRDPDAERLDRGRPRRGRAALLRVAGHRPSRPTEVTDVSERWERIGRPAATSRAGSSTWQSLRAGHRRGRDRLSERRDRPARPAPRRARRRSTRPSAGLPRGHAARAALPPRSLSAADVLSEVGLQEDVDGLADRDRRRARSPRGLHARARRAGRRSPPRRATSSGAEEAIALCTALLPEQADVRAGAVLDPGQRPRPGGDGRGHGRRAGSCCSAMSTR